MYERLLGEGILIRDCSNFRGLGQEFYRVAVKSRAENKILLGALHRLIVQSFVEKAEWYKKEKDM